MPKAYPYYDADYKANVEIIRAWLEANAANVFPVGRNGMHRYNNQDHSMYTAMLTVENLLGADHDVWSVNVEEEYHEINERPAATGSRRGTGGTGRDAPVLPKRPPVVMTASAPLRQTFQLRTPQQAAAASADPARAPFDAAVGAGPADRTDRLAPGGPAQVVGAMGPSDHG